MAAALARGAVNMAVASAKPGIGGGGRAAQGVVDGWVGCVNG